MSTFFTIKKETAGQLQLQRMPAPQNEFMLIDEQFCARDGYASL